MSEDSDVARAWLTRWNADNDMANVVPGGISADRMPEPQGSPYAELTTSTHKAPAFCGTDYIDYRKVVVTVFGVGKEVVGGIVSAIRAKFDSPAPLDFSFSPAVVAHMRTEPLGPNDEVDDRAKSGDDVRKVVIPWVVWTHRRRG